MSRLRQAGGRVSSAVVAQGTAAAASLVLQVVVVRAIGDAGFGTYQVLLAALLLITTLQTGMIGDSLNVLDRDSPGLRGALMAAQGCALLLGASAAATVAAVTAEGGVALAAAFSLATAFWLLEDTGRRLFMARLRFWHLVANDVVYLVVVLGVLSALAARPDGLDLVDVLLATAAGAAAAFLAAVVQLPAEDFRGGPVTREGVRELVSFGGWRSAQAGIRPLTQLLTRTAVLAIAGAAALGQLQAARLLLAPALTALQGFGSFLLPTYRRQQPGQGWTSRPSLARQALVLGAAATLYTVAVVAVSGPLTLLLFSEAVDIDPVALAGWGATSVAYGIGLPLFMAALVRRESRRVFFIMSVDALVGVPLAVVVLVLFGASWTPFALTFGMVLAAALLWRTTPPAPHEAACPSRPGLPEAAARLHPAALALGGSGVVAAGALLVQVVAAVTLSAADFGAFVLVLGLLAALGAVHRGVLGEALLRVDRGDPAVRGSLVTLQLAITAAAALVGAAVGAVLVLPGEAGARTLPAVLALLFVAWSFQSLLRRLLVLILGRAALLGNDLVSAAVTLLALLGWHSVSPLGVADALLALTLGAGAAVIAAVIQLPAQAWRPVRPALVAVPTLLADAGARTVRFGVVPLAMLAVRLLVAVLAGRAALGALEAARLLLLPALAALSAGRAVMLPGLRPPQKGTGTGITHRAATALLVVGVLGTGLLALALVDVLAPLFAVDRLAVLGWTAAAAALAAALPASARLAERPGGVATLVPVQVAAGTAGLTAAAAVLLLEAPQWTPLALAVGAGAGAVVLSRAGPPAQSPARPAEHPLADEPAESAAPDGSTAPPELAAPTASREPAASSARS